MYERIWKRGLKLVYLVSEQNFDTKIIDNPVINERNESKTHSYYHDMRKDFGESRNLEKVMPRQTGVIGAILKENSFFLLLL